ncbi:Teichoic acids export ATP-binding protein TagH [Delftia tsuruhatensis]|uniref:ABC transporter ATP-binding protein n=1 Tax=Delftia tsuruhatensis TaxID=180282 RepID=UPI001E7C4D9B|nr:ABC transporter ATP-binding protein [Delftia tsuruhatensis]CAB5714434.1 Teichoic acids export ATP-binding protein TagH [Delftia tsuruhatensis]CAC9689056.1 Teichoic acids export ATP-binding protein TagH [Delftia tsuruhatensis]
MSSDFSIEVESLSKCYRIYDSPQARLMQMLPFFGRQRFREFWALRDISFRVAKGESVGIIGRNGSGKSTLLQIICRTLNASTGSSLTRGKVAALLELGSGFNPDFTGRENVYLNGALLGMSREEMNSRFDEIADFANIGDFMEQPTKTYSSGMLVRLAFSVSACIDPDILIIDEALAVGDASFQFKCLGRLEALAKNGTTLLFVSHDMSMVKRFCNKAIYLSAGRLKSIGSPEEMAEMYLLDMRDEQRQWASSGKTPVAQKKIVNNAHFAFGTKEGEITSAHFTNTGGFYSSFAFGENIDIEINCRFHESVHRPNISLTVQEARLLVVGGQNFQISSKDADNGWISASLVFRFPAKLSPGRYHITIKLMNGHSEETSLLIEKQVGLLSFDTVASRNHSFLGIVDLGIELSTPTNTDSN